MQSVSGISVLNLENNNQLYRRILAKDIWNINIELGEHSGAIVLFPSVNNFQKYRALESLFI